MRNGEWGMRNEELRILLQTKDIENRSLIRLSYRKKLRNE